MKQNLSAKIHRREISDGAVRSKSYRKLYSDRQVIGNLDIVNELDGHSGCVNALSWSKSGALLASGSDDQHLNIHSYQPSDISDQFQLAATVATGHTQNIFSVKFMPHHDDRIVVTCAGDGEVRIFDLEHAGQTTAASTASTIASEGRKRGRNNVYNGVRYLSDGDTDCRVYRSHGDRVKRIVTESSPFLFLTCSEDGEVRQWDLRQPSSAYPAPRGGRYGRDRSLPPPLISYKRYGLDLNTISCSGSQPHYIALGGAHLHAFLHDRRMTGRDRLREAGRPLPAISEMSEEQQEQMSQATQCVRKFAPAGEKKMKRSGNGHITACKISDARPDEMVVSWSGDHIYSFDLVRVPGDDGERYPSSPRRDGKSKKNSDRKRKRKVTGSSETSLAHDGTVRASSRPRTESANSTEREATLRIRYQNGQSEDIALPPQRQHRPVLTERQTSARRLATATVKIRSALFGREEGSEATAQFTTALGHAASILPDMDQIMRDWGYPMEPNEQQVYIQKKLRRDREMSRRFVQAAGTLARVLGGRLQTPSGTSPMVAQFTTVEARSNDLQMAKVEQFVYDFVKAILLWLESGVGRLVEGFTRPAEMPPGAKAASRLPIPESEAATEAIDDILIPYLLGLADEHPIVDVEANKFEVEENRQVFPNRPSAVRAFAAAVKIPFADLSSAVVIAEGTENIQMQDRQTAHRYWARKVARGLLVEVTKIVNSALVDLAFGGQGHVTRDTAAEEARLDGSLDDNEDEVAAQSVEIVGDHGQILDGANAEDLSMAAQEARAHDDEMDAVHDEILNEAEEDRRQSHTFELTGESSNSEEEAEDEDEDEMDVSDDEDDVPSDTSSEPDEEDGVPNFGIPRYIFRSSFQRRRLRPKVEADTPCSGPTRKYHGHCNVRTVKDVNYFGPDDEYVVSGSDDGHLFIWDRQTSELVNILEGDGEVVNVIQGHPYETMLAVSGIDHTIKIFSPDARAREVARLGHQGIFAHDASAFSSLAWPLRIGRRSARRRRETDGTTTSEPAVPATLSEAPDVANEDDEFVAPNGLGSRKRMHNAYRIMQQNDIEREGGNQDSVLTIPHAHLLQMLFGQLGNANFPTFE